MIVQDNDLFASLSGGMFFSKLDLSQAYQQLELEDNSKQYSDQYPSRVVLIPSVAVWGFICARYFLTTMGSMLSGIPNVIVYLDDILVSGATEEEHTSTLIKVLERLQAA